MTYIPRLKQEYKDRVVSALKEEFGYKNVMEVPKLEKIVVSRGVGAAVSDSTPWHGEYRQAVRAGDGGVVCGVGRAGDPRHRAAP